MKKENENTLAELNETKKDNNALKTELAAVRDGEEQFDKLNKKTKKLRAELEDQIIEANELRYSLRQNRSRYMEKIGKVKDELAASKDKIAAMELLELDSREQIAGVKKENKDNKLKIKSLRKDKKTQIKFQKDEIELAEIAKEEEVRKEYREMIKEYDALYEKAKREMDEEMDRILGYRARPGKRARTDKC